MKNLEREAYLELRAGTRQLLDILGVASNPMVSDEWIVNQLRAKKALEPILDAEVPEDSELSGLVLFQNSLAQVVTELGGHVPEPDGRDQVLEARRLIWVLHSLFARKKRPSKTSA